MYHMCPVSLLAIEIEIEMRSCSPVWVPFRCRENAGVALNATGAASKEKRGYPFSFSVDILIGKQRKGKE